ncbi:glycosyltransferase [Bacillus licheniformis]|nr:glycosyltransferase [Bacillus licheniformis]
MDRRFAAARNESFKHATKDYILYLDADDVLLEEDQKN